MRSHWVSGSGFDGADAADAEQIEDQQDDAESDRHVGDVENIEGIGADVEMEEVRDGAVDQAIEAIGQCPADSESQAQADQGGVGAQPPDGERDDGDQQDNAEAPTGQVGQQAIGNAGIPDQDVVEEIGDAHDFATAPIG